MLLCRAGRLSCAALGPARTAPGFLLLHGPGHVTSLTAPVGRHLHRCRFLCGSVVETRAHPNRQKAELKWGTRLGFVTAEWRPLNRARTEAARLSGGEFDRGRATGGLFTGNWGVSCRRPFTTSMQSRSSSTKQSAEPLDSSKVSAAVRVLQNPELKSSTALARISALLLYNTRGRCARAPAQMLVAP